MAETATDITTGKPVTEETVSAYRALDMLVKNAQAKTEEARSYRNQLELLAGADVSTKGEYMGRMMKASMEATEYNTHAVALAFNVLGAAFAQPVNVQIAGAPPESNVEDGVV